MSYALESGVTDSAGHSEVRVINEAGPTGVNVKLSDYHGDPLEASQVRDLRVDQPYRMVGAPFEGATIDTNFWTSTVSGAGAANVQAAGIMTTSSGTANSGFAQVQSVRRGRFIFAHPHICRKAIRIPTVAVAGCTRRWGAFTTGSAPTPTDGFWFELSPAGVLSINMRNAGGTVNTVSSGFFNGEGGASYTLDTNVHAFEIHFYVMGVEWMIDNVRIHTSLPTTSNFSSTYTLPVTWNSSNSASGTTSGSIECWSANMVREGRDVTLPTGNFSTGTQAGIVLKRAAGNLHGLVLSNGVANAVVTLYDNTTASAPVIWDSGALDKIAQPMQFDFHDLPFYTGLTLAVSTQACNVLVIYE